MGIRPAALPRPCPRGCFGEGGDQLLELNEGVPIKR